MIYWTNFALEDDSEYLLKNYRYAMLLIYLVQQFAKISNELRELSKREFKFLMGFQLKSEHIIYHRLLILNANFLLLLAMENRFCVPPENVKYSLWETSANPKRSTATAEVTALCLMEYESCRPLRATGIWNYPRCRRSLHVTWSTKQDIAPNLPYFGK